MDINQIITQELEVKRWQVDAAVQLIDEGNTIPFIARYRKEAHGTMNDEQLRKLFERLTYLRNLEEKKAQVLSSIESQGKLTPELRKKIEEAETQVLVEDLYRPYRPKRRTRAMIARERGLEPLSQFILKQETKEPVEKEAEKYVNPDNEIANVKDAIAGAMDIIAESVSDDADYRLWIRNTTMQKGKMVSTAKDEKEESVYEMYYEFEEPLTKLAGHRILALNRGEKEKFLTVKVEAPEEDILRYLEKRLIVTENPYTTSIIKEAVTDSYKRLIAPAIEREIRNDLTEKAEDGSIEVFKKNLEQLLMQPPISGHTVLGWDPAFRTGCKLAVVNPTGKVIGTTVIYPTAPTTEKKIQASKDLLKKIIPKYNITLISVGNGTASRESEQFIVELLKEIPQKVQYIIVNEAGASVYSASKLATEEFPNFDVGQRSATSIARRLQDPLAELVKIDPKSIGVGQYQHDMNQKKLGEALSGVVEDCVNKVGVDLNTASAPLLAYISGISAAVAKNIVAYREENGSFTDRKQLLKVAKLGPKAYQQCAGFMRIKGGVNPLDGTSVHPESYEAAEKLLKNQGYTAEDVAEGRLAGLSKSVTDVSKTAEALGIGEITLTDIMKELEKPGRDPRDEMPKPILRSDILEMKDLKEGMILKGTVRNVIDFGVFVDIGVHQDGLVHISEMTSKFIKHPLEMVSVGDIVDVRVLSVDLKKKRIQLSMKLQEEAASTVQGASGSGKSKEETAKSDKKKQAGEKKSQNSERTDQKNGKNKNNSNNKNQKNSNQKGSNLKRSNNTATVSLADLLKGKI
ncbi:MAG: RNA-binding transcriptional accessory protein [Dorea sp.]|nr:RNA-binding transcriptional accessory protein [Dorea sp.]